jgi:hypothetical protein
MEPVQIVEQVFFPLDEKLELQPGSLTPLQLSYLMHFATLVSFERAAKYLMQHHGVSVSASTSRRQTEALGASAEMVQNEQAKAVLLRSSSLSEGDTISEKPVKQAISSDGSYISLRGKIYAEVKTVVIGEVHENKCRLKQRPEQEVKMTDITYFSRMTTSETFTELAAGEVDRRGFFRARQVCAVSDGAEWIQHFIDGNRADAVRILDFYHAAEYVSDIATLVRNAGTALPESWLEEQLQELKHQGPKKVLEEVHRLLRDHPYIDDLEKSVNYLQKREEMMQYPLFQQQGWPIGSGSVESANTCVVQSRLKGPGMHWEPRNVNPLLALRTGVCNDRWDETRNQAFRQRLLIRRKKHFARQKAHYEELRRNVQKIILHILLLSSSLKHPQKEISISSRQIEQVSVHSTSSKIRIPASNHPWRRFACAKK